MPKGDLRIDILGTSFSINADEDSAYLEKLLGRYRAMVEHTGASMGMKDPLKIAILTGFLLCDEIQKLKAGKLENPDSKEAEKLTLDLIARIDAAMDSN